MDLVADMLVGALAESHEDRIESFRIRPPMRRRFSRAGDDEAGRTSLNVDRGINRFWDYPRLLRRSWSEFDLFHVVDHSYGQLVHALPPERTVVTCHDLHTFECILDESAPSRSLAFRRMTRRILDGVVRAGRVVFDTEAVRDEAVRLGLVKPDRTAVAPLGVHASCSPQPDPAADEEARRLLASLPEGAVPLLHVGGTFRRKRIDLLLRIFAQVRTLMPEARLVRVGGPLTAEQRRIAQELGVESFILELPYLSREVLAAVYRASSLVLLPSEEEGFGLPLLEAQACGTPVVASDLPVLREIGGDAALFRPVGEVTEWSAAVAGLLSGGESDRKLEVLRRAGLIQAERFTWNAYARKMVEIYKELLEDGVDGDAN
jgi:glycosyltransferase involved in cell wall biosynthesis